MDSILLFSDGACSGNPGPGGWAFISVINRMVFEDGAFQAATTNNRMELLGCINGLKKTVPLKEKIIYYTDSSYVLYGANQWIHGWKKRHWKTADGQNVLNQDLWEELDFVLKKSSPKQIDWKYCKGHSGVPGNERCDEISVSFCQKKYVSLYQGPIDQYSWDLLTLPPEAPWPDLNRSSAEKKVVYSYLSIIHGKPMRHKTWKSCEARVKGQSGAKFKKSHSAEEEFEILKSWGVSALTQVLDD